jgi:hypothetical protein
MYATEVVMHVVKRNHVTVIVHFLAVSVRQSGKAPHLHSHRQILTLYEAGAYILRVGITAHNLHIATDALRWRVAPRFFVGRRSIDFLEHGVVNIGTEGILYSL